MPDITFSQAAIDNLLNDPKLRQWREAEVGRRQPCLSYFHRYYSIAPDGTVTEHGDGFSLTTIDPEDPREMGGHTIKRVAIAEGFDILVTVYESIMSGDFTIGLTARRGLTYEPRSFSSFRP